MIRVIILCLSFLGLAVCTAGSTSIPSYQEVLQDPLIAYRKGHYRYVVEFFEKNSEIQTENRLDYQYIWASSYLELRQYDKAFEKFYQIDGSSLEKSSQFKALFPFYIRKYLSTLIKNNKPSVLTDEEGLELLKMVSLVPFDSPVRQYLDNELFSVLWNAKNYNAMLLVNKNLSDQGKAWRELAKSKIGQAYNLSTIIKSQKTFAQNKAYEHLLPTIDITKIRNTEELSNLTEMYIRIKDYREKSLEIAERYTVFTKDKEFFVKTLACKLLLDGERTAATDVLMKYAEESDSLDYYTYLYEHLVKRKLFDLADEIALKTFEKFQKEFKRQSKISVEFNKNPQYILNWYKQNYQKITDEQHLQVLRALIRVDISQAERASDIGVSVNQTNPSYLLIHALIKEHLGKKEDAYKYYLRLIFQEAFGYSGIVAKQKEKQMRNQFRDYFEKVVAELTEQIPHYKLKDRLMLYKSFLVDDELAQYVNRKKMEKDQKEFNKIVYADINKVSPIPILEKYPKILSDFAPETQDYVENSILEVMKKDKDFHNTARYFYKYRDLFINSDIEGYLTFRLYFYIRDKHGYSYLPNYPKDIVDLVFPKPEFELIKEWSDNDEDLAYWMLSSFMAESHFRKRVYSHVGAVGFAQVMPYTAVDIKRWLKAPHLSNFDFYDNMRMGVFYHKKMYDNMDKNVLLSLAAYNAGPGAVRRWLKKYKHIKDDYLFIEAIEYQETRNYVKIINYNHGMYRLLNDYDLY